MKTICLAVLALAFGVLLAAPVKAHGLLPATETPVISIDGQAMASAGQIDKANAQDCDQKHNGSAQGLCCGDMVACCVASTVIPPDTDGAELVSYQQATLPALSDPIGPSSIPDPYFKPPRRVA